MEHCTIKGAVLALIFSASFAHALEINEIRIDQPATDNDEYFELVGRPDQSLDGISYLVIGDGTTGSGTLEAVIPLDGLTIPPDGFFLATENTFSINGDFPDLVTTLNFENSDNVTHMLVDQFSVDFVVGDDLDSDDNGTLDETPWGSILDVVSLIESADLSAPSSEHFYGDALGFAEIGPTEDGFGPSHIYRVADEGSSWEMGGFAPNDLDTPGLSNSGLIIEPPSSECDFNSDGACDSSDIDSLTAVGNLVAGVTDGFDPLFDLTKDNQVNGDDISRWLELAGEKNGFAEPLRRGDANLDGMIGPVDLNAIGLQWLKNDSVWSQGDFDGDGVVGPSDLNVVGLGWLQSVPQRAPVPEPSSWVMMLPWLLLSLSLRRRAAK